MWVNIAEKGELPFLLSSWFESRGLALQLDVYCLFNRSGPHAATAN